MRRWQSAAIVVATALTAAIGGPGCLSKKPVVKQRYVLPVARTGSRTMPDRGVVRIGRIRVSPLFERKGFVYLTGEERFEDDFYNEFFAPPGVVLRKAMLTWMGASPMFAAVLDAPGRVRADWLVEGRADRLYGDLRRRESPTAVIEIEFTVVDMRSPSRDVTFKKSYRADVPASEASAQALAVAWRQAVSEILTSFEADLLRSLPPRAREPGRDASPMSTEDQPAS